MTHETARTTRATAAEVCRNFGLWQDRAMGGPVLVTNHGRPKTVLLSVERYEARADGGTDALGPMSVVVERIAQAHVAFDARLRLSAANRAACDHWGTSAAAMIGLSLAELFGGGAACLIERTLMRVLAIGDARRFDAPTDVRGRTLRLDAFPLGDGVGILFDTVDADDGARIAQAEALARLIAAEGGATGRLNLRGVLAEASDAFARLIGMDGDRLMRARLGDLIRADERADVDDLVERVLSVGETLRRPAHLLGRDGEIPVRLALTPTRTPAHLIDGAALMVTPLADAASPAMRVVG